MKEQYIEEGFPDWSRRDFQQFIRGLEAHGWYDPHDFPSSSFVFIILFLIRDADADLLAEEVQEKTADEIKKYYKVFKEDWKLLAGTSYSSLILSVTYGFQQKHHELKHGSRKAKPSAPSEKTLNICLPRRSPLFIILCKNWSLIIRRRRVKYTVKKRIDTFFVVFGTMVCIWTMLLNGSRRILQSFPSSGLTGSSRVDLLKSFREDVIRCWG